MLKNERATTPIEHSMLIAQAADFLGVSRRTIYYRIRDGRLRTIRTRCHSQRILLSSIFELLRDTREPTGGRRAPAMRDQCRATTAAEAAHSPSR